MMKYLGIGAALFGVGCFTGFVLVIKILFKDIKKSEEKILWAIFLLGLIGGLTALYYGRY